VHKEHSGGQGRHGGHGEVLGHHWEQKEGLGHGGVIRNTFGIIGASEKGHAREPGGVHGRHGELQGQVEVPSRVHERHGYFTTPCRHP
jgi:hypothetical protein